MSLGVLAGGFSIFLRVEAESFWCISTRETSDLYLNFELIFFFFSYAFLYFVFFFFVCFRFLSIFLLLLLLLVRMK